MQRKSTNWFLYDTHIGFNWINGNTNTSLMYMIFYYTNSLTSIAYWKLIVNPQWAFTCSKLTIEILEQGVKYVQS